MAVRMEVCVLDRTAALVAEDGLVQPVNNLGVLFHASTAAVSHPQLSVYAMKAGPVLTATKVYNFMIYFVSIELNCSYYSFSTFV